MSGTPVGVGSFGFIAHFCSKSKTSGLLELGRTSQLRRKEEKKAHPPLSFPDNFLIQALSKTSYRMVRTEGSRLSSSSEPLDDFKQLT